MEEEVLETELEEENVSEDDTLFTLSYPEYERYERGWVWYFVAGLLMTILLIQSLMSANYIFGVILVLLCFLLILRNRREPKLSTIKLAESGVWINGELKGYRDFQSFWNVYDPPMAKNLYFDPKGWKSKMSIPLDDIDPVAVRTWLRTKVKEDLDQKDLSVTELLSRILKI